MSKISKISILIPCYNEEKTIRQVIINAEKSLININLDYEIIVVDDYSNDGSSKKLLELKNEKKLSYLLIVTIKEREQQLQLV